MKTKNHIAKFCFYIFLCILIAVSSCIFNINQAYAYQTEKAYSWKTTINANIGTDGAINISETKILDITPFIEKAKTQTSDQDQPRQAPRLSPVVWNFWDFPEESDLVLSNAKIGVLSNEDTVIGNWQTINTSKYLARWNETESPNADTYTYDSKNKQMCLYSALLNSGQYTNQQCADIIAAYTGNSDANTWNFTKAIINLNYSIVCAPNVYKDVVDYRWNYCQDSWKMDSYNVSLNVSVPVGAQNIASPLGKITNNYSDAGATTERNIYAWGHGSSTGILDLDPSGQISLNSEIVPGGSNAEVRIVFPSAWLTNLDNRTNISQTNQTKLTTILKEESVWRDGRTDQVNKMLVPIVFSILSIIFIAIIIFIKVAYNKKFMEESILKQDLDSVHPCVLVRLKNWNHEYAHDIVAGILALNQEKLVKIKRLCSGDFEINLGDKNHAINPYQDKQINIIDKRTINFLFHEIACSNTLLRLSDILNYARARSFSFMSQYLTWHSLLTDQVNKIANFKSEYDSIRKKIFIFCIIFFCFCLIVAYYFSEPITALIGLFSSIVICLLANSMRNRIKVIKKDGSVMNSKDIKVAFSNYTDTSEQFRIAAIKTIKQAVLDAQDLNAALQLDQ